jgi:hypothetical protein
LHASRHNSDRLTAESALSAPNRSRQCGVWDSSPKFRASVSPASLAYFRFNVEPSLRMGLSWPRRRILIPYGYSQVYPRRRCEHSSWESVILVSDGSEQALTVRSKIEALGTEPRSRGTQRLGEISPGGARQKRDARAMELRLKPPTSG